MKLLLWLAVIWIGVLWFMHTKKAKLAAARRASMSGASATGSAAGSASAAATPLPEPVLPCASCGVHVPRSEALLSVDGKQAWCCEEHRRRTFPAAP